MSAVEMLSMELVAGGGSGVTTYEYLRVSDYKSGKSLSTEEQHDENEEIREELGITLSKSYEDEDYSASTFATKARPDFDALVMDLQTNQFHADLLHLWEASRGSRQVSEWVMLLDLLKKRGKRILVTTHRRIYDPANWADRQTLLREAVDNEADSAKKSAHLKRTCKARARAGKPHGRCLYGYQRHYDPYTREFLEQLPHPEEHAVIWQLFKRVEAGHAFGHIARVFKALGYRTRSGKVFAPSYLQDLATNPAYAGFRSHKQKGTNTVELTEATWPALVSRERWYAVQEILSDSTRSTYKPGRAGHFVTMIGRCDVCTGPLTALELDDWELRCARSTHVRVNMAEVDRIVEGKIFEYLSRPDVYPMLVAADNGNSAELSAVRASIAKLQAELNQLPDLVEQEKCTVSLAASIEQKTLPKIRKLEAQERELATPTRLRGLIPPGRNIRTHWATIPMSARREIARHVLVPELLGQLRITRAGKRVQKGTFGMPATPVSERVRFVTTAEDVAA